jgi:predicted kinase
MIYMMVGLPASGKSTVAKEITRNGFARIIVAPDVMRALRFGVYRIGNKEEEEEIMSSCRNLVKIYIEKGMSTIFDATNLTKKSRRKLLSILDKKIEVMAVFINTPLEQCLINNDNRDIETPKQVILNMNTVLEEPSLDEGFTQILRIKWDGK